jgi:hypothetical protein
MSTEDQSFIFLEDAALVLKLSEAELVSTLRRNGMRVRNLVWPDFEARAEGPILKVARVSERHYLKAPILPQP